MFLQSISTTFILGLILLFLIIYYACGKIVENFEKPDVRDPYLDNLVKRLYPLDPIVKDIEFFSDNKSYTINKEKTYMCLRDEQGQYYDPNSLTYVLLHEIAHSKCDEIGHTKKFEELFAELLEEAHKKGLYDPNIPMPNNYCNYG